MLNKLKVAVSSRTVWTIVIIFVVNGIAGIHDSIPANFIGPIDAVLSILAAYFRVNPRV